MLVGSNCVNLFFSQDWELLHDLSSLTIKKEKGGGIMEEEEETEGEVEEYCENRNLLKRNSVEEIERIARNIQRILLQNSARAEMTKIRRKKERRKEIAFQILKSETQFRDRMSTLIQKFVVPIERDSIIESRTGSSFRSLFEKIRSLLSLCEVFVTNFRLKMFDESLKYLHSAKSEMLSPILSRYFGGFYSYFTEYKREYENFKSIVDKNVELGRILRKLEEEGTTDLDIFQLLKLPLSRFSQLFSLLVELLESTENEHLDYQFLKILIPKLYDSGVKYSNSQIYPQYRYRKSRGLNIESEDFDYDFGVDMDVHWPFHRTLMDRFRLPFDVFYLLKDCIMSEGVQHIFSSSSRIEVFFFDDVIYFCSVHSYMEKCLYRSFVSFISGEFSIEYWEHDSHFLIRLKDNNNNSTMRSGRNMIIIPFPSNDIVEMKNFLKKIIPYSSKSTSTGLFKNSPIGYYLLKELSRLEFPNILPVYQQLSILDCFQICKKQQQQNFFLWMKSNKKKSKKFEKFNFYVSDTHIHFVHHQEQQSKEVRFIEVMEIVPGQEHFNLSENSILKDVEDLSISMLYGNGHFECSGGGGSKSLDIWIGKAVHIICTSKASYCLVLKTLVGIATGRIRRKHGKERNNNTFLEKNFKTSYFIPHEKFLEESPVQFNNMKILREFMHSSSTTRFILNTHNYSKRSKKSGLKLEHRFILLSRHIIDIDFFQSEEEEPLSGLLVMKDGEVFSFGRESHHHHQEEEQFIIICAKNIAEVACGGNNHALLLDHSKKKIYSLGESDSRCFSEIEVKCVHAGYSKSSYVTEDGRCFVWGMNFPERPSEISFFVPGEEDQDRCKIDQISFGMDHTVLQDVDGSIYVFNDLQHQSPIFVLKHESHHRMKQISSGKYHTIFLSNQGSVYQWGRRRKEEEEKGKFVEERRMKNCTQIKSCNHHDFGLLEEGDDEIVICRWGEEVEVLDSFQKKNNMKNIRIKAKGVCIVEMIKEKNEPISNDLLHKESSNKVICCTGGHCDGKVKMKKVKMNNWKKNGNICYVCFGVFCKECLVQKIELGNFEVVCVCKFCNRVWEKVMKI